MKKFEFTINGNKYSVDIKEFEDEQATIQVNGTEYLVEIHQEKKKPAKTPKLVRESVVRQPGEGNITKKASTGGFPVEAPLPGSIFKLKVKVGDTVVKGDSLLILEAMKMENDVLADQAGVIKEIKVKEGDAVLQNDLLLVIG
ncbi:MAG: biotin/lipoyl-containing protein [Salinimicrobium sediminis]|uniref:Biotin-requiring enzyme n=1 Tax=Salinimicrobium sediminis TaxID=1343891 RepID=A0A285X1J0_9FLAO|nr:biotin/lipoyl-containing protein [Salinimicrobium sediminis]MDX1602923.1 biotin/lipoyl-containing protein [Salinimicrobium sediminis]MDX1752314.1 biotin/lipoyl-containing protein [Salinimicrobium sediminis]SOC79231.1 Biotin-requiring enzyme [Salinimicrobium sediminis]